MNASKDRIPYTPERIAHLLEVDLQTAQAMRSAPELLEVVKAAEKWAMLTQTDPIPWLDDATSAIRKTEGAT